MKYLQQQKEYKKAIEILKEVFERKKLIIIFSIFQKINCLNNIWKV